MSYSRIIVFIALLCLAPHTRANETISSSKPQQYSTNEAKAIVERLYLEILGRYPDDEGLEIHTRFLTEKGKDEDTLKKALRYSNEGKRILIRKFRNIGLFLILASIPATAICLILIRTKNRKLVIFKLSLIFAGIVLACLIAEIALRLKTAYDEKRDAVAWRNLEHLNIPNYNKNVTLQSIIRYSTNPKIIYQLIPNLNVRFGPGTLTTGSDSFRVTPTSQNLTNALCIVGLGDSVMFGWGVNDNDTYLSQLCAKLKKIWPAKPIQVINTAVPGYNTTMEVELLKDYGLQYHPDIVLIHFVPNDIGLPNFIRKKNTHTRLTRSYLIASISQWIGGRYRTKPQELFAPPSGEIPDQYKDMAGPDACCKAIETLHNLSIKQNFKCIVISDWNPPDFLKEVVRGLNIPLIELGPVKEQYRAEHGITEYKGSVLTVSKKDPHYSAVGHSLVADTILKFLVDNNVNPETAR